MATFDQLSPEQRAIVELVLRQGKTYGELADMLNLPEPRVRALARDALVELAPVSVRGVEEDWRGQLADYVLGQQAGPEATATKGHLRRSEAARSWARSLLDSLEQFYANGSVPAIPEGERRPKRPASAERTRPALAATTDPVMRRRLLAGAGGLLLLVQAARLAPSGQNEGYYVWLYNSPTDAKSLGGQVTDQRGNYQALGSFPADYKQYKYIDISRQQVGNGSNVQHSGESVLRGPMPKLRSSTSKKASAIGQTVLRPPS